MYAGVVRSALFQQEMGVLHFRAQGCYCLISANLLPVEEAQ